MTIPQPSTNEPSKFPTRALILGGVGIILLLCALASVLLFAQIPFLIFATGPMITLPLLVFAGVASGIGIYLSIKAIRSSLANKSLAWVGALINSALLLVSITAATPILVFWAGYTLFENEIPILNAFGGTYMNVEFSPSGEIAAAAHGTKVDIIDIATGKKIKTLSGFSYQTEAVKFSPDGKFLAGSFKMDHKVIIWDAASLKKVHTFDLGEDWLEGWYFSPDSQSLILLERNTGAVQVNLGTFETKTILTFSKEFLPRNNFYLSRFNEYLGITSDDFTEIQFWKIADYISNPNSVSITTLSVGEFVNLVFYSFSPNGNMLAIPYSPGGNTNEIKIFDAKKASLLHSIQINPPTDTSTYYTVAYTFSPDSKTLTYIDPQHHVVSVNLVSFESTVLNSTLQENFLPTYLKYSPDGSKILISNETSLQLWDAKTGNVIWGKK